MAAHLLRGIRKRGRASHPWTPPVSPQRSEPSQDEARSAVITALIEMITCPVCLTIIAQGNVARCANDHLVCSSCHANCERCPYCRDPWQGRSRNAERLRNVLLQHEKIPCTNATAGCSEKVYHFQMENHLAWCNETVVTCPGDFNRCHWTGPIRNLVPHVLAKGCATLVSEASTPRIYELGAVLKFPNRPGRTSSTLTTARSYLFKGALPARTMACLTLLPTPDGLTLLFRYFGQKIPHLPYTASCSALLPYANSIAFSFGGPLHFAKTTLDEIHQSGHFMQLTDRQVIPLLDGVSFMRLTVAFPLDPPETWSNPPQPSAPRPGPEEQDPAPSPRDAPPPQDSQSPSLELIPLNLELPQPVRV